MLDLHAYFSRIDFDGERTPTLATLHAIVRAHAQRIPFENLDVLLGKGIDLTLSAIEQKLVHAKRGGYCFEQNTLLLAVLTQLGFDATPLSARVRIQRARHETPPRTHVFLRVEIDGESFLADVGVGGLSPTCALRLLTSEEQTTPHDVRRIVREGNLLFHQMQMAGEWQDVCEFTLETMPPIDREVANWFTSTHPASHFKNRLMAARALPDGGRLTLLNRELTERSHGGRAQTTVLGSEEALLAVLFERFGLLFPAGTRFPCPALGWP